jgi:4-hydroxy-tetrahydrodipicolinate reductase
MKILLVGHGRMGRMVEALAPEYGCEVAGIVDPLSPAHSGPVEDERWRSVDVAIDFTLAEAVLTNVPTLARRGVNIVLGTTGWQQHEATLKQVIADAGSGMIASANFSVGVAVFEAVVAHAAQLMSGQKEFGAWMHEEHHAMKKDAPSGTALMLKRAMEQAGYRQPIDVSSTRAGHNPGVHTVGFDGPAESITLSHAARDRTAFARGALMAAQWVKGRKGWFTMRDVLGLTKA